METKLTPEQQLAIIDERIDEIRAIVKPYQEKLSGLLKGPSGDQRRDRQGNRFPRPCDDSKETHGVLHQFTEQRT